LKFMNIVTEQNSIISIHYKYKLSIFNLHDGNFSDFFSCNIGLVQGESLSPFLYAMYVNDIERGVYYVVKTYLLTTTPHQVLYSLLFMSRAIANKQLKWWGFGWAYEMFLCIWDILEAMDKMLFNPVNFDFVDN
jgi:hypothetical protein